MTQNLDLKRLERLAFLRTFQDGLYDIYLGGLFASFAAFGFTVFPGKETETLTTVLYYLSGVVVSALLFFLGKKFITVPRIGLVKFGQKRQKRNRDLVMALAMIVTVQVFFVLLQFSHLLSPTVRDWLAPVLGQADNNRLMVAVVAVIFVTPGMLAIAYFADIPHGFYHAVVMALAISLMILLDQAWWMVLGGVLILLPGLVQFFQFLQRYPMEKISDERP